MGRRVLHKLASADSDPWFSGKKFIVLRDKSGSIQLIISKHESEKSVIDAFYDISKESVIMVEGIVKKSDKAPRGVEIFPLKIICFCFKIVK